MTGSLLHKNFSTLQKRFITLSILVEKCQKVASIPEKIALLDQTEEVICFLKTASLVRSFLQGLSLECELVIKSVWAIGQGNRVFYAASVELLRSLLNELLLVDRFYREMGGILGYQHCLLRLLLEEEEKRLPGHFYRPEGLDIRDNNAQVREAQIVGIASLGSFAEIYPVGGAADRLGLVDPVSQESLPAARLLFLGRTLLEGLIRDLSAREYLHFQLFGKQLVTPIAMMTSQEKKNHEHLLAICEEQNWFARGKGNFCFFAQPSVPTIDQEGDWCLKGPCSLLLKPGGHGVIWKLAKDEGVFSWLKQKERTKALVRQINNPIAGVDYGLAAFTGWGILSDKRFGFASCARPIKAKEGTNLLLEREIEGRYCYLLTNVEYSDFKQGDLLDKPLQEGGTFSPFPANTNLLFVDLAEAERVTQEGVIPGKIVNFKKATYQCETGDWEEKVVARLESTMQNIADLFAEEFAHPLEEGKRDQLKTFITYHDRGKTISSTKQAYHIGGSLVDTPEGAFFDYMSNMRELLGQHCGMSLPTGSPGVLLFTSFLHPALGPFYAVIAQKIRGGTLGRGAHLELEIADLYLENLLLEGSLCIEAKQTLGHYDDEHRLIYSNRTGKCVLKNVTIKNSGVCQDAPNVYWKNKIEHRERCVILLEGMSEFHAENLILEGERRIVVRDGYRVIAYQGSQGVEFREEKIAKPTWRWVFRVNHDYAVILTLVLSEY